jgi:hypothetical protein
MPFMFFTYLMRGIDLPSILIVLLMSYLVTVGTVQCFIFLGCLPASRPFKALLGLGGLGVVFWFVMGLNAGAYAMMSSGVGSMLTGSDFWKPALTTLAVSAATVGLLYFLSVALITPHSANRALPVRVYLTVVWVIGGLVAAHVSLTQADAAPMQMWLSFSVVVLCVALLIAVSERSRTGPRIRRCVPRRTWLRPVVYLFYSGAASGVMWVALLVSVTLLASAMAWRWLPLTAASQQESHAFQQVISGVFLYVYAYALTAAFVRRRFMPVRFPESACWVLALLLMSLGSIGPVLIAAVSNQFDMDSASLARWYYLGNLFALGEQRSRGMHLLYAGTWSAVATIINCRWIARQVLAFRRVSTNQ